MGIKSSFYMQEREIIYNAQMGRRIKQGIKISSQCERSIRGLILTAIRLWSLGFLALGAVACTSASHAPEIEKMNTGSAEAKASETVSSHRPKIGLILGPGGLKTFAHIGVLKELEKANVSIHSIVGLEWGALIGGIYSITGKSNEVEWKMMRLSKGELSSPTWFSSDSEPKSIGALEGFIKNIFERKKVENSHIAFSCPTQTLSNERRLWLKSGLYTDAIMTCLPFPPLYRPNNDYVASAFEVKEAAKKLRDGGAEVVVFVNVLAQGRVLKHKRSGTGYETQLLWNEGRRRLEADQEVVDFVIGVHTREYDILNYDARRSMILFGSQSGVVAAQKISEKYGF